MRIWRSEQLSALPGIAHGFFGREGGVSEGLYASLNCGPGSRDAEQAVEENRRRAVQALAGTAAPLFTLYQVHGARTVIPSATWDHASRPQADAMATNEPGKIIGILTADCAPVLLADAEARVIGAAHAGWKGAFGGVLESVLDAMEELGANRARIHAAIGPCISQDAYEVGPEFRGRFLDADPGNDRFFKASPRKDHHYFALEAYVAERLKQVGAGQVHPLSVCTYGDEKAFFSFRCTTHRGEPDYGRQLSAIGLIA
jgi:YfiH family protein